MKTRLVYLIIATSLLFSGCATITPLTKEERSLVKSIYLESNLPDKLEYLKLGTLRFSNEVSKIDNSALFKNLENAFISELSSRGYNVVNSAKVSDLKIVLDAGKTYNHPSEMGVSGAGFFTHIVFGLNAGIQAQASIVVRLVDPVTSKQRYVKVMNKSSLTSVRTSANSWNEFSSSEKNIMMNELKKLLSTIAIEALDKAGL